MLRLTSTEFQAAPGSIEDHTYVNDGLLVGPNSIGWAAEVVR